MMLYNETIGIDKDIEPQLIAWLRSYYIPEIMKTKLFADVKIYKVLTHDDENSTSLSVQFFSNTIEDVLSFINNHSERFVQAQQIKFKDRHITFRTLLEEIL